MPEHRGIFVAGTDTGVGKTTISVGLVAALATRRRRVAVMKPCETGRGDDAERLVAASGRKLDLALVRPYAFDLPAAPEIAARRARSRVDLGRIEHAYAQLRADADVTVVEGAGGLLVPLADGITNADLIARLDLPLLLVARTRLGTINHTLLTAEVARRRGLRLLGVVFSGTDRKRGPEEDETIATIVRHGELRSFGVVPYLPAATRTQPKRLAAALREHLALDRLVQVLSTY